MDEPVLPPKSPAPEEPLEDLRPQILALLRRTPHGVLCTQTQGQPYGALVSFAYAEDLKTLYFATARTTRKYAFLSHCPNVALVVDDRSNEKALPDVHVTTITGHATELEGDGVDSIRQALVTRHPHLRTFYESPSTAVFSVRVIRYFYVKRFQDVREWRP